METKNIYAYNPKETEQASMFSKLMRNVYRWMTFALAITGLTAACVAGNATLMQFILGNQAVFLGLIIAELVVAFTLIGRVSKLSFTNASLLFILYSILTGATLSTIFLVYEIGSIASTFFVTAGTFGAMSLVGYFTHKDLSKMGTYLIMVLIGLIIATIANWFIASTTLDWGITYALVLVFVGLTAYDTQKIKVMLREHGMGLDESTQKLALMGSFTLYLDFLNLFLQLLKILGKRKCLTVACGKSEWEQSRIVTKNSTYISNGVNIDKLNANLINANEQNLEDFNIKKNVFTAYTVGRINYQKWPELFNEIAQKLPEMQFVWIGDGDMRDKLTADNIVITGWLEHKEAMELSTKFDAFILASRYEGLPISLLEAMYMKKACVVSNVVGNRDVIKNDYNGYICDETDQFVEALKDIEKGNSDKLIEQAYSDILNEFNSKCLCNKYKEVYNESRSK